MNDKGVLNQFRGIVFSKYKNASEFARALNWPRQKMSRIMTGEQVPTIEDAACMAREMQIPLMDVIDIFCKISQQIDGKEVDMKILLFVFLAPIAVIIVCAVCIAVFMCMVAALANLAYKINSWLEKEG